MNVAVPDPMATHWLFGIWDAPFVADHGWYPFPENPPAPQLMSTDGETAQRCMSSPEYLDLTPIGVSFASEPSTNLISSLAGEAFSRTVADQAYIDLRTGLGTCITGQGYEFTVDDGLGAVNVDSRWSAEKTLQAMLAAASCNDQLAFAQQASDIDASYQLEAIRAHQAELVAIQSIAIHRVSTAKAILAEVGIA